MAATIHSDARTPPKIRQEIQVEPSSVTNVTQARSDGCQDSCRIYYAALIQAPLARYHA